MKQRALHLRMQRGPTNPPRPIPKPRDPLASLMTDRALARARADVKQQEAAEFFANKPKRIQLHAAQMLNYPPPETPADNVPRRVLEVLRSAAIRFDITVGEIRGGRSFTVVVAARRAAAAALFDMGYNLSEIGRHLHKHHTTVIYYLAHRAARLAPLKPPARELGEIAADEWSCMS